MLNRFYDPRDLTNTGNCCCQKNSSKEVYFDIISMDSPSKRVKRSSERLKTCADLLVYHNCLATSLLHTNEVFFDNSMDLVIFSGMMTLVESYFLPKPSKLTMKSIRLRTFKKSRRMSIPAGIVVLVAEKGFDEFVHPLLNNWTAIDKRPVIDAVSEFVEVIDENFCFGQDITSAPQESLLTLLLYKLCRGCVKIIRPKNLLTMVRPWGLIMSVRHGAMQQVRAAGFVLPPEINPWCELSSESESSSESSSESDNEVGEFEFDENEVSEDDEY